MLDYFCNFFKGKKPRGDVSQKISASKRKLLARELSSYDAVVITGGSSGIGRGFIEVLDDICHVRLCNISRNVPSGLENRSDFLHISCDLANSAALDSAFREVCSFIYLHKNKEKCSKNPKILLINNSGFGAYGEFPAPDIDRNCQMIDLNVRALTRLCGLFHPLIASGGGAIINIASTAAFQACPQLSVYAATKSYVLSFTMAIGYELNRSGCKCLCVCPGPTSSNFFAAAGFNSPPLPGGFGHKPCDVAIGAYTALAKGKNLKVIGLLNSAQTALVRLLPMNFVLSMSGFVLKRIRKT